MKPIIKKIFVFAGLTVSILLCACNKTFLDVPAQGQQTLERFYSNAGAQSLLVGAYHDLTGISTNSSWWSTSGTYWVYGDLTAGDAYTGGPATLADASTIEQFQTTPSTGWLAVQWTTDYDGISRANTAMIAAANATDMTSAQKTELDAEARFLRAHYHFNAKIMWNNIPYVDDSLTKANMADNKVLLSVSNTADIWPYIEQDLRFAYDNLPETQSQVGRINKWAAACYIAKCYMFQKKYDAALALLDTIINQGKKRFFKSSFQLMITVMATIVTWVKPGLFLIYFMAPILFTVTGNGLPSIWLTHLKPM
jgi:hypothetical protein